MKLTPIPMDVANRMLRIGTGLHDGHWFARIDLWWIGVRMTWAWSRYWTACAICFLTAIGMMVTPDGWRGVQLALALVGTFCAIFIVVRLYRLDGS